MKKTFYTALIGLSIAAQSSAALDQVITDDDASIRFGQSSGVQQSVVNTVDNTNDLLQKFNAIIACNRQFGLYQNGTCTLPPNCANDEGLNFDSANNTFVCTPAPAISAQYTKFIYQPAPAGTVVDTPIYWSCTGNAQACKIAEFFHEAGINSIDEKDLQDLINKQRILGVSDETIKAYIQ